MARTSILNKIGLQGAKEVVRLSPDYLAAGGGHGAVLLLAWGNFQALLPVGLDFDMLEGLSTDPSLTEVIALLLAESGYALENHTDFVLHMWLKC